MFLNVNGKESRVSATTSLRSGDVVGMRFDIEEGTVCFDLNGFDYGEAYRGEELKEGSWYPTVDLGTGEDSVVVAKPP